MKATFEKTAKKLDYIITIKVGGSTSNKQAYFSITADKYISGKPRTDSNCVGGGACGDELAKLWPEFKIFNDLHLCDSHGVPMYFLENGFFYVKEGNRKAIEDHISASNPSKAEIDSLMKSKNLLEFVNTSNEFNIIERQMSAAKQAISILEQWTGEKFQHRNEFEYISQVNKLQSEYNEKKASGYFTPEQTKKRISEAKKQARNKIISKNKESINKKIKEAEIDLSIELMIFDFFGLNNFDSNYIFYNHTNELVFNWKNYGKQHEQKAVELFTKKYILKLQKLGVNSVLIGESKETRKVIF